MCTETENNVLTKQTKKKKPRQLSYIKNSMPNIYNNARTYIIIT